MGERAVAHGAQLGGDCTLLIPHRIVHELVTKTLVWFSSGRACSLKRAKYCICIYVTFYFTELITGNLDVSLPSNIHKEAV